LTKIVIESARGSKRGTPFPRCQLVPEETERENAAMDNDRDSVLLAVCTLIELLVAKGLLTPEEIRQTAAEMEELMALHRYRVPPRPMASDDRHTFRTA